MLNIIIEFGKELFIILFNFIIINLLFNLNLFK